MSPEQSEPVLRERDWTIAERIEQIEQALKRDPYVPYRRQIMREYLALTTDPEERGHSDAKMSRVRAPQSHVAVSGGTINADWQPATTGGHS